MLLGKSFGSLSLVLIACLCMYLSARYTSIRWIQSNNIPGIISIFVIYLVVNHILALFCPIFARWFIIIILTLALIFAIKEIIGLNKIITWYIVDLEIGQNEQVLLARQIRMKRTFKRLITVMVVGGIQLIVPEYLSNITLTAEMLLRYKDASGLSASAFLENPIVIKITK